MSQENVKQFYQKLAADETIRTKLTDLFQPYAGQELDEERRTTLANQILLPFAEEQGLPFTLEELRQFEEDLIKRKADGELSEEELEAVAGGLGIGFALCIFVGLGLGVMFGFCWIGGAF